MVELITSGEFVRLELFWAQTRLERMCPQRTERHPQEPEDRAEREEETIHWNRTQLMIRSTRRPSDPDGARPATRCDGRMIPFYTKLDD